MAEGYHCAGNGDCSSSWLDELLCEYVDGTMDPTVRAAFEECLSTDPVLAQQVVRLRHTRTLLCRHGCQVRTPRGLQARVRRRLAQEMMHPQPSYDSQAALRVGVYVAAGSVIAAVVMAGLLVGTSWLAPEPTSIADRPAPPPMVLPQHLGTYPSATMTPLMGSPPVGVPSLIGQPASTPQPLIPSVSWMPGGAPSKGALQRTGGSP